MENRQKPLRLQKGLRFDQKALKFYQMVNEWYLLQ